MAPSANDEDASGNCHVPYAVAHGRRVPAPAPDALRQQHTHRSHARVESCCACTCGRGEHERRGTSMHMYRTLAPTCITCMYLFVLRAPPKSKYLHGSSARHGSCARTARAPCTFSPASQADGPPPARRGHDYAASAARRHPSLAAPSGGRAPAAHGSRARGAPPHEAHLRSAPTKRTSMCSPCRDFAWASGGHRAVDAEERHAATMTMLLVTAKPCPSHPSFLLNIRATGNTAGTCAQSTRTSAKLPRHTRLCSVRPWSAGARKGTSGPAVVCMCGGVLRIYMYVLYDGTCACGGACFPAPLPFAVGSCAPNRVRTSTCVHRSRPGRGSIASARRCEHLFPPTGVTCTKPTRAVDESPAVEQVARWDEWKIVTGCSHDPISSWVDGDKRARHLPRRPSVLEQIVGRGGPSSLTPLPRTLILPAAACITGKVVRIPHSGRTGTAIQYTALGQALAQYVVVPYMYNRRTRCRPRLVHPSLLLCFIDLLLLTGAYCRATPAPHRRRGKYLLRTCTHRRDLQVSACGASLPLRTKHTASFHAAQGRRPVDTPPSKVDSALVVGDRQSTCWWCAMHLRTCTPTPTCKQVFLAAVRARVPASPAPYGCIAIRRKARQAGWQAGWLADDQATERPRQARTVDRGHGPGFREAGLPLVVAPRRACKCGAAVVRPGGRASNPWWGKSVGDAHRSITHGQVPAGARVPTDGQADSQADDERATKGLRKIRMHLLRTNLLPVPCTSGIWLRTARWSPMGRGRPGVSRGARPVVQIAWEWHPDMAWNGRRSSASRARTVRASPCTARVAVCASARAKQVQSASGSRCYGTASPYLPEYLVLRHDQPPALSAFFFTPSVRLSHLAVARRRGKEAGKGRMDGRMGAEPLTRPGEPTSESSPEAPTFFPHGRACLVFIKTINPPSSVAACLRRPPSPTPSLALAEPRPGRCRVFRPDPFGMSPARPYETRKPVRWPRQQKQY
ncbi:hypothetical protein RJ55_05522 [Drechmeria coniospora]|nr:hypothetical protein RJ55_05522 [Drechmeria coniospora]